MLENANVNRTTGSVQKNVPFLTIFNYKLVGLGCKVREHFIILFLAI